MGNCTHTSWQWLNEDVAEKVRPKPKSKHGDFAKGMSLPKKWSAKET